MKTKNAHAVALGRKGGQVTSERKAAAVRENGRRGGRRPSRTSLIAEEYRDSDGYWIYLAPGWQNGADPGTHGIVEDTKQQAYRTLGMVKRCDCESCIATLKLRDGDS